MIRSILMKYALPAVAAVVLVALIGVPYLDGLLTGWFRSDVQLRARLVMSTLDQPLANFLDHADVAGAENYLAGVASDERLLGVRVCGPADKTVLTTPLFPPLIHCGNRDRQVADGLVHTPGGQVELSTFPLHTSSGADYEVLLAHDLGFIDRRRTTARNLALASVLVAAVVLAILAGLAVRLLFNRWLRLLLGDISKLRFLDDAESPAAAQPALRQVRELLDELEAKQRLEIEFHENWTPQALQQVVREHARRFARCWWCRTASRTSTTWTPPATPSCRCRPAAW